MSSVHDLAGRLIGIHSSRRSIAEDLGSWRSSADGCRVRSFLESGSWLVELDTGAAPLEVYELVGTDVDDLLSVQLAELELLHEGHPRLARIAPQPGQAEAVFVDRRSRSWVVWLACHRCGGYALTLPYSAGRFIDEPEGVEGRLELELAREAALLMMGRFVGSSCPCCNSLRVRGGEHDFGMEDRPVVWLDVLGVDPGWQLWMPLEGSSDGVSLPLGLPAWCGPDEVDEAAAILTSAGRAEGRAEVRVYDWEEDDDEPGH